MMKIVKKFQTLFPNPISYLQDLLLVFLVYFIFAKLGLYVFYEFATSPALIWPPVGIALAAIYFKGYRIWPAILLAQFLATISYVPGIHLLAFIIAVGYTLQAIVALYVMRKLGFESSLHKLRNVLILINIAFFVTMVEPIIATIVQMYLYPPLERPFVNFTRAWAGGIFSALVITPFIFSWPSFKSFFSTTRRRKKEIIGGFLVLSLVVYIIFWTAYPAFLGITTIFILPAVLIWFALNMEIRWTILAVIYSSFFGFAGYIIARPTSTPLNEQLMSAQIYLGLIAAIFLVFSAVVEERREAYKSLEDNYNSTLNSDNSKSKFIAILAHELRNPLASIVTLTELLQLKSKTIDFDKVVENIKSNSATMTKMLDELLDTVRLSQGKFKLRKEIVDLKEIIKQATADKRHLLKKYEHELRVILPKDNLFIFADPIRIKQIIVNLVGNACKYTDPGGKIEILISVFEEWVIIKIIDNGIGMEEDTIKYIYEPFRQSESAMKQESSGIGIGLFLTKELIEMHGGGIKTYSAGLGRGSTFTVYLPILSRGLTLTPVKAETTKENIQKNKKSEIRVMLVDDNEELVNPLKELLSYHGYEAVVAYSGKEALDNFDISKPEIIFLDIGMPEMGGREVAKELRSRGWEGKIIALSGYGQEADLVLSKDAGFDDHFVKPVDISKILEILASLEPKNTS